MDSEYAAIVPRQLEVEASKLTDQPVVASESKVLPAMQA